MGAVPNNPSLSFTLPTCPLCPSRIDLPGCFSYTTGHLDHKKRWPKKRRRDSSRETRWNWERSRVERSIAHLRPRHLDTHHIIRTTGKITLSSRLSATALRPFDDRHQQVHPVLPRL